MINKREVLIVEDNIVNIKILENIFKNFDFDLYIAKSGYEAIFYTQNNVVDIILLSIVLKDISGFDVCQTIKTDRRYSNVPIIFLTSETSASSVEMAFLVGGSDYIKKPLNAKELIARMKNHLALKSANEKLIDYQQNLETQIKDAISEIKNLNKELEDTQKEVIFTMGAIAETRSKETGNHVKRVAEYSYLLAKLYGLDEDICLLIKEASPMHDVGKVAIPDDVLNKAGKLTEDEYSIMKRHSELGYNMLNHSNREILKTASIIAYEHHEKYNGFGYPRGLKGDNIHIYGRIVAIADVFDALGSDRCYKKAWELQHIIDLFRKEKGEHFDPILIDLFLNNLDLFIEIRDSLKD